MRRRRGAAPVLLCRKVEQLSSCGAGRSTVQAGILRGMICHNKSWNRKEETARVRKLMMNIAISDKVILNDERN
jgi:hypothetical protein